MKVARAKLPSSRREGALKEVQPLEKETAKAAKTEPVQLGLVKDHIGQIVR